MELNNASILFRILKHILSICDEIFPLTFTLIFDHFWFSLVFITVVKNNNCRNPVYLKPPRKYLSLWIIKINIPKLDSIFHHPCSFFEFWLQFYAMVAIFSHVFDKPNIFWSHNFLIKISCVQSDPYIRRFCLFIGIYNRQKCVQYRQLE